MVAHVGILALTGKGQNTSPCSRAMDGDPWAQPGVPATYGGSAQLADESIVMANTALKSAINSQPRVDRGIVLLDSGRRHHVPPSSGPHRPPARFRTSPTRHRACERRH